MTRRRQRRRCRFGHRLADAHQTIRAGGRAGGVQPGPRETGMTQAMSPEFGRLHAGQLRPVRRVGPPSSICTKHEIQPACRILPEDDERAAFRQLRTRVIERAQRIRAMNRKSSVTMARLPLPRRSGTAPSSATSSAGWVSCSRCASSRLAASRGEIAIVGAIEIELGAKLHGEHRRTFTDLEDAETLAFRQRVQRRSDLLAKHPLNRTPSS